MQELGVSEEKIKEMENADDPKDEYSCFFGCMALKEGLVRFVFQEFSSF